MTTILKSPAKSLIVAPRLPSFPKTHTGNPFTSVGDMVLDCDQLGCGWHWMGPRSDSRKAIDEHRKQYHGSALGPLVIRFNHPRHQ